jgi:hypothetical protein
MPARNRKSVDLAAFYNVKCIEEFRPQAHARHALAEAIDARQPNIGQLVLLRDFVVNPRAEPSLIALAQQTVVRILGVAKLGIGVAKLRYFR